ncbi:metal ABC transporter solute-binding protein, Zn/Mn family [Jatrophihabitans sp. DSM 45814]
MISVRSRWVAAAVLGTALGSLLVSGCASSGSSDDATAGSSARISVVASTDVYGDIVSEIAGDKVKITSIIDSSDADPHSYEANTQNQLALSKAKIVIENGGGYDDFMDALLKTAGNKSAKVLNVVDISGKATGNENDLNEHVWYDFPTIEKFAAQLVTALANADPADASTFTANARTFSSDLKALEATEATIKASNAGAGVAITEPVPLYLLQACGLVNKTPADFSKAVEEESDVSPRVLSETLALFDDKQVKLLAYNEQTSGATTERALAAAKANHIPVVPVTETLPAGKNYVSWMSDNLNSVRSALDQ